MYVHTQWKYSRVARTTLPQAVGTRSFAEDARPRKVGKALNKSINLLSGIAWGQLMEALGLNYRRNLCHYWSQLARSIPDVEGMLTARYYPSTTSSACLALAFVRETTALLWHHELMSGVSMGFAIQGHVNSEHSASSTCQSWKFLFRSESIGKKSLADNEIKEQVECRYILAAS
jgi:hypothetical protein